MAGTTTGAIPPMRIKLDPPAPFDGTGDYEKFSRKLVTYMALSSQRLAQLMRLAITPGNVGTTVTFENMDAADAHEALPAHTTRTLAITLYYVLSSVITGSAGLLVEQVEDDNGLEAWRKLGQRYLQTRRQTTVMLLVKLVNTKFHEERFETEFAQFELDIGKFETALGAQLHDDIKMGLVVANTTGKLHDHLVLTLQDIDDYAEMRNIVSNYCKS